MHCDFISSDTDVSINPTSAFAHINTPRKRGRPLKKWATTFEAAKPKPTEPPTNLAIATPERALPSSLPLNVDDMQLFYHYITETSLTFGNEVLWRDKAPIIAFECPYVLRLILAISAAHLARNSTEKSPRISRHKQLAEAHFSIALREITTLLPQINSKNCSALYIAAVLVCYNTFAKVPKKGHLLVIADDSEVAWWNLFRGVRFVIQRSGFDAIFAGPLRPALDKTSTTVPPPYGRSGYIPWEAPLADLKRMIRDCKAEETGTLEMLRQQLAGCFRDVYGTMEKPEDTMHGKMHVVIRWLWILEDDFIGQIKESKPAALILLAHFAVLLKTLECYWFMRGWASHVITGIEERLDLVYSPWASWPKQQINWQPD